MHSLSFPHVPFRRHLPFLAASVAGWLAHTATAGEVFFDGDGTGQTILSVAENWNTDTLPTTTDQAIFTDAAFGGPLPASLSNSSSHTWGNLVWDSSSSASLSGTRITLSGNGGNANNDLITVGSALTSGTLSLSFSSAASSFITAQTGNINVVNAGATLTMATQFEFNNAIVGQVITKTGAGTLNFTNGNNGNVGAGANSKFVLAEGTLNFTVANGNMFGGSTSTIFEIHDGTFLDTAGAGFPVVSSKNYAQIWAGDFTYKGTNQSLNLGTGAVTLTGDRQVTVRASTLTVGGAIGDGSNGYGLTKEGVGTLTLTGASTYTGATSVNSGTLRLQFNVAGAPSSNIINSNSSLRLGGGALLVSGTDNGTSSQTFDGLTVGAGSSLLNATSGTSGTVNVAVGAVTRETGGLLNFVLPADGAISTTSSNDANGLLGAGMTVGNNWATVSGGNIVAFTAYDTQNAVGSWGANQNITNTGVFSGALASSLTVNSVRMNSNNTSTVNLGGQTLTVLDGILVTSAVGQAQTISNGTIRGSAGGDLVVINNNNTTGGASLLTISANVVDNTGATAFTKGGTKTVVLSGSNSYTGATYVNSGILQAGSANPAFGNNSAVVISTGAALNLNSFSQTVGSLASNNSGGFGTVTLGSGTLTTGGDNTSTTFGGTIAGTGGFVKVGTGTQTLTGANTYTGATEVNLGTLLVNGSLAAESAVAVNNGGTLGGLGVVGGLVTTGGTDSVISPGNSPGMLTLAGGLDATAGVKFVFELGTTSDVLNLGSSNFTGSAGADGLVFDFYNTGGLAAGTAYTLITFGSSTDLDYSDLTANVLPAGFVLDTSFGTDGFQINGNSLQVQFAVVPEPSTLLMIGMGAGCFLWNARRKRNS
jgi:autotransporter-associated beta strand protein